MSNHFNNFNISKELLQALESAGFTTPTPVQEKAIPVLLEGHDILATAQTGTGKTLAFLVPVFERLKSNPNSEVLILVPTRELAQQVATCARKLMEKQREYWVKAVGSIATLIGGQDIKMQRKVLAERRCRIVVGTPGRTIDHIDRRNLNPSKFDMVVLDEADRMFDMGFGPQIQTIFDDLPRERQTILFSATFGPQERKIASRFVKNPKMIELAPKAIPVERIKQEIMFLSNEQKYQNLLQQLDRRDGAVIVFVRTKMGADKLAGKLARSEQSAAAIHGDLRQSKRARVVSQFTKGETRIMVATDVAARGLDIPNVRHVINYDLPDQFADYVHRIGRTGRAGADGSALCFCTELDKKKLAHVVKAIGVHGKVIPAS